MLLIPGTGNGKPGTGVWELMHSSNPLENSKWRTKQKKGSQRNNLVWEQVYSRGKFVLKASHWSRNVHWDIVVVKSFGGKFATSSDENYRSLKFSAMGANMRTRLESKIVFNSRKQAVLLTKFGCNIHLAALSRFLIYFCSIRGHVTF